MAYSKNIARGTKMKCNFILVIVLGFILIMVSGCISFKQTSKSSNSASYQMELGLIGYKPVKTWTSNYGDITLYQSMIGDSCKLDGPTFKKPVRLKVQHIEKFQIWRLKEHDALVLVGVSAQGEPLHEVVTVSTRRIMSSAHVVTEKAVYHKSNNFKSVVRGELPKDFKDSIYYAFGANKHEGPVPWGELSGDLLEFYQDQYIYGDPEPEVRSLDYQEESAEIQKHAIPALPESEYEAFRPAGRSVVPTDKVSTSRSSKKVEIKID